MKTGKLHVRIAFSFVLLLLVVLVASLALVNLKQFFRVPRPLGGHGAGYH